MMFDFSRKKDKVYPAYKEENSCEANPRDKRLLLQVNTPDNRESKDQLIESIFSHKKR